MQETLKRSATYTDLEAVPPHLVAEILRGRLAPHARTTGRHSSVHFRLGNVPGGLWLVDPRVQVLEVFALTAGRWTLVRAFTADAAVGAVPFDAIEFQLGRVWPPDRGAAESE